MTTFSGNGGLHVEAYGTDSAVWHRGNPTSQVGAWNAWESLGGGCIYYPAAITLDKSTLEVFVVGLNSHLYAKVHDCNGAATTSGGWFDLGGVCQSAPVVCSANPKSVVAVVVGMDRNAWACQWDGTKWTWNALPPQFVMGDSLGVCSWGPDRYDVACIGTDGAIYQTCWAGGKWATGWTKIPGLYHGKLKIIAAKSNRLDIFAKGSDTQIWHNVWDGSKFLPAHLGITGTIVFEPEAVIWCNHRIDLFAVNTNCELLHAVVDISNNATGVWSTSWENLGGKSITTPKAVVREGKYVDIFTIGTDSQTNHRQWDGSQWLVSPTSDEKLGGTLITRNT